MKYHLVTYQSLNSCLHAYRSMLERDVADNQLSQAISYSCTHIQKQPLIHFAPSSITVYIDTVPSHQEPTDLSFSYFTSVVQHRISTTSTSTTTPTHKPTSPMCKLYLQTLYLCGCPGHRRLPGRTCSHYRQSLAAIHSERGTSDITGRPCISVVPMLRFGFACPRHRGSQEYWLSLRGWEGNVSVVDGGMG